jgi:hypothetical protein
MYEQWLVFCGRHERVEVGWSCHALALVVASCSTWGPVNNVTGSVTVTFTVSAYTSIVPNKNETKIAQK